MDETTQAQRLAEWLQSPAGTVPPEDLDPEVLAAVYALRPDRVPAPRVRIEDILGAVGAGPFHAQTADEAPRFRVIDPDQLFRDEDLDALAASLDGASEPDAEGERFGRDPTEDGPTVEAPRIAANTSAFEVGEASSGLPTGEAGSGLPTGEDDVAPVIPLIRPPRPGSPVPRLDDADVVSDEAAPVAPRRPRRGAPAWLYPLLGVGFAAAAVLMIGLPIVGYQLMDAMPHLATNAEMAPAAAPPPAEPDDKPIAEATSEQRERSAEPPLADAQGAPAVDGAAAPTTPPAGPPQLPAPSDLAQAAPVETATGTLGGATGTLGVAGGRANEDAEGATMDRMEAAKAPMPVESPRAGDAPPPPPPPPNAIAEAEEKADRWSDDEAEVAKTTSGKAASAKDSSAVDAKKKAEALDQLARSSPSRKASAPMDDADAGYASSGAAAPAAPAASASAPSTVAPSTAAANTTTGSTTRTTTSALSDRAGALAFDYNSAWYTRYADVATAWNAAAAQEKAKDYNGAVATYAPFLSDSRVDVAQDAAWRTARDLWARGDASAALLTVEGGLARGGGDSVYRVHLLVLQGDLFNAMGRPSDAAKSWAEAARLNRERSAARTGTKAAPPK